MATPGVYDFDFIRTERAKLQEQLKKDEEEINKQRQDAPVVPATPDANADDFIYGCGFDTKVATDFVAPSMSYSYPKIPFTKYYYKGPPFRVLP